MKNITKRQLKKCIFLEDVDDLLLDNGYTKCKTCNPQ